MIRSSIMSHARELFDGPPVLRNRRLGAAITAVVLLWFVWAALLTWLFGCTLIDLHGASRLLALMVSLSALTFLLFGRRWGIDRWGAFVFGLFGLVPFTLSTALALNRFIGPVHVERHRIIGLVRSSDSQTFRLKLEGDPFYAHQEQLLDLEADAALWYADTAEFRIRRGLLGYDVLLERTVRFTPGREPLPDLPR